MRVVQLRNVMERGKSPSHPDPNCRADDEFQNLVIHALSNCWLIIRVSFPFSELLPLAFLVTTVRLLDPFAGPFGLEMDRPPMKCQDLAYLSIFFSRLPLSYSC